MKRMKVTLAHKAASYQIGDPDEAMVSVPHGVCVTCGGEIVPLLGKVLRGHDMAWSVWIEGNYEHVERPAFPHPALHPATVEAAEAVAAEARAKYAAVLA